MLDKVKITLELWSVIHVLKECELKNQVLFLLTLSDMKTVVQFIVLPLSILKNLITNKEQTSL